jgi:hypothetical protein
MGGFHLFGQTAGSDLKPVAIGVAVWCFGYKDMVDVEPMQRGQPFKRVAAFKSAPCHCSFTL